MNGGLVTVGRGLALAGLMFVLPSCGDDTDGDSKATHGGSAGTSPTGGSSAGGEGGEPAGGGAGGSSGSAADAGSAGTGGDPGAGGSGTAGSGGASDDAGGSAGAGGAEPCDPATTGNWTFGSGNLNMTVAAGCFISNFCSIEEGIHTQGTLTASELHLDSVGGQPLSFAYTLIGDTLTIIDGFNTFDLPLSRTNEPLPDACPPP
ncbi:MAG TPA: hypothetical protein VM686_06730 [Polyangiaceae bacterium]|jgi:hypothetical protein|nr:hypothetical protein [Polyangiaceae bacterium]